MAVSKLLLAALGLGGVALVVSTRKSKPAGARKSTTIVGPLNLQDQPICSKYPSGQWLPGAGEIQGFPPDSPGWNDDDIAMAQAAVDKAIANAPAWSSLSDARKLSFTITRDIIAGWCPNLKLPSGRATLEAHLQKSLALRWNWTTVENKVWNRLVGDATGN